MSDTQTQPSNPAEMLVASNLYCERDDRILFNDLNFSLAEGQVMLVRGSNGSGKTTLLRILCGLNDGYEGSIRWYGDELSERADEFAAALLYIGHRAGVNKVLTPLENLRWSCSLQSAVSEAQLLDALSTVGLRGFEYSACFGLSAGQQQRVALARLLLSPAKLWVLDEPFTTLDIKGVRLLESLLTRHAQQGGSVLVTTHHSLEIDELLELNLG
ncbi:MAG: heme exporter protein A [Pseudohongiellaceae bacterium]|jgi:heme exporter protein A